MNSSTIRATGSIASVRRPPSSCTWTRSPARTPSWSASWRLSISPAGGSSISLPSASIRAVSRESGTALSIAVRSTRLPLLSLTASARVGSAWSTPGICRSA
jgi:hypothetical protein